MKEGKRKAAAVAWALEPFSRKMIERRVMPRKWRLFKQRKILLLVMQKKLPISFNLFRSLISSVYVEVIAHLLLVAVYRHVVLTLVCHASEQDGGMWWQIGTLEPNGYLACLICGFLMCILKAALIGIFGSSKRRRQ